MDGFKRVLDSSMTVPKPYSAPPSPALSRTSTPGHSPAHSEDDEDDEEERDHYEKLELARK